MIEKRKYSRYMIDEELCAFFDEDTFGQLIDISKNGISVLLLGVSKIQKETVLSLFHVCGTVVMKNVLCEYVQSRRVWRGGLPCDLYCYRFVNPETYSIYIDKIIQDFSGAQVESAASAKSLLPRQEPLSSSVAMI